MFDHLSRKTILKQKEIRKGYADDIKKPPGINQGGNVQNFYLKSL